MGRVIEGQGWRAASAGFALLLGAALIPPSSAQTITGLAAVRVANSLTQPLFVTAPPGDYDRIFIVQQTGQVLVLHLNSSALNGTPFLDIHARLTSTSGEQGLLGMAFDPNYVTNGKFYLNFVVPGGFYGNGTTHISQFKVSANADVADTSDEKVLLTFDHPEANHNGGWIGFSPRTGDDNNLYIAVGDGGNSNDQDGGVGHIEPGGNAQNTTTLLGKMLRLHVDSTAGTASIPANNPFFGSSTNRQEIFAFGLRNPFRDSFDRLTGTMFIGDVGQSTREEVDVQKPDNPGGGENYEWRLREGTIATPASGIGGNRPPGGIDPIIDYPRATGGTVTGGYVYRGKQIPNLRGTYVFGDYLVSKIFALNYDGNTASNFQTITPLLFPTSTGGYTLNGPASFGEDANGEIYIAAINTGSIFKIVPTTSNVMAISVSKQTGGSAFVNGTGVPFQTYNVQATDSLAVAFQTISALPISAAGDGTLSYEDTTAASPSVTQRFYRFFNP